MTDNAFALALGAFLTSSGFGGLMAAVAAGLAYLGVRHRLVGDKEIAEKNRKADADAAVATDALERWWDAFTWLWDNREHLGVAERALAIQSLRDSMVHKAHGGILGALASVLLSEGGDGDEEREDQDGDSEGEEQAPEGA